MGRTPMARHRAKAMALEGPNCRVRRLSGLKAHLQRMCAFWPSVTLMTGRYHGQPVKKHLPLSVDARHFDRLG